MNQISIALALLISLAATSDAFARGGGSRGGSSGSHAVKGHTTKSGAYVAPHRQTNPNGTRIDNWSTRGNVNPYTGKPGSR